MVLIKKNAKIQLYSREKVIGYVKVQGWKKDSERKTEKVGIERLRRLRIITGQRPWSLYVLFLNL